jgi:hypothetical protein
MMINWNGLIETSFRHLTGSSEEIQTKKITTNLSQDAPCRCWDSNRAPSECEYEMLLLYQPALLRMFTISDTSVMSV